MQESKLNLLKSLTLLLIEDDEELRNNLSETLSLFFKEIISAKNGAEAIKIFNKSNIDLIMTDYVMPIMNGYEFCKEIRKINGKIPIVIMSNFCDNEKLLKLISLELTEYLIKPIEYTQLTSTLLKMIEKLERENLCYFHINNYLQYNFFTKELINNKLNEIVKLTKSEIAILELLIKNVNTIITTETIEYNLSPVDSKSEQAIKNLIHRLRSKLTKDSIINVQGIGYILRNEVK